MEQQKCGICSGDLTNMKEAGCMRCLKCNPIVEPHKPKEDKSKRVDVPWTQKRIEDAIENTVRGWIKDELQDWHKMTLVHEGDMTLTEVAVPDDIVKPDEPKVEVAGGGDLPDDVEIPLTPPKWTDQAESLDIKWRGRKKDDVLQEIEDKLTVPA